jgi:hypothetical protein
MCIDTTEEKNRRKKGVKVMKTTTKVLAVLGALVLAGLWLPQVALAGYCPDSGNCCETDADCAGEGEECLDRFGLCETSGEFCDDDLDCGGTCSLQTSKTCADGASCGKACSELPHIVCVQDENCVGETNLCVDQTCEPVDDCVQEPEARGRCEEILGGGDETPCAADGACPEDQYCVRPGECVPSGIPCQAGLPSGICSSGDFEGDPCRADSDCAHCSGGGDVWCEDDSDCGASCSVTQTACVTTADCLNKVCEAGANEGLYCFDNDDCDGFQCIEQTCEGPDCITDAICLMPHAPEGLCDGIGPECQDNGDCDGGTCVFSGSCTVGQCADNGLPCTTAADCGTHCEGADPPITGCTTDADCGAECSESGDPCTTDADCGLACTESLLDCSTTADCRTTCFADGVDTGWPCPDVEYCQTQPVPPNPQVPPCSGAETCECKLYLDTEACEPDQECKEIVECVPDMACNINTGCTTAVKQRCNNDQGGDPCDSDDDCSGCLLRQEACATDADCPNQCSDSGEACTDSCPKVCDGDPTVECVIPADCTLPGLGNCVSQTCDDNYCAGTCEPAFVCKEVATGKCTTRPCTRDNHCADLGAEEGDYTCSGDVDCCTRTCGGLEALPDPQCGEGDCESCYAPACLDNDDDGYGDPGNGECPKGAAEDCDDDNYNVNPGATEGPVWDATCHDGLDNDCDTKKDADDPRCIDAGHCAASASASPGGTGTGTGANNSGWYVLLLAGVLLVSVSANRIFGHKKE